MQKCPFSCPTTIAPYTLATPKQLILVNQQPFQAYGAPCMDLVCRDSDLSTEQCEVSPEYIEKTSNHQLVKLSYLCAKSISEPICKPGTRIQEYTRRVHSLHKLLSCIF